jgi:pullulanase/glycogen debranching enzyme
MQNVRLSKNQMMLNKLAALYLFSAQGPVMIHEGQEYARSKVIAPTSAHDPLVGTIDHNSYNKDNETNYLNYAHRTVNDELYSYYKGLIQIRNRNPILCDAAKGSIEFIETKNDFHVAMRVKEPAGKDASDNDFLVILNGHPVDTLSLLLPAGKWQILADAKAVTLKNPKTVAGKKANVPPTSGMILKKAIPTVKDSTGTTKAQPDSAKKR